MDLIQWLLSVNAIIQVKLVGRDMSVAYVDVILIVRKHLQPVIMIVIVLKMVLVIHLLLQKMFFQKALLTCTPQRFVSLSTITHTITREESVPFVKKHIRRHRVITGSMRSAMQDSYIGLRIR